MSADQTIPLKPQKPIHIVLITTCDTLDASRVDCLKRLRNSIDDEKCETAEILHVVMLQNASSQTPSEFAWLSSSRRSIVYWPGRASISSARNIMLRMLRIKTEDLDKVVFGFPDDDCCYPTGFLNYLATLFSENTELDLWTCYENWTDSPLKPVSGQTMTLRDAVRTANSNTMFMRGKTVDKAGLFDDRLGAGALFSGSEDTDFAMRCHFWGRQKIIAKEEIIWHRGRGKAYRGKYYPGALLAVAWNCRSMPGLITELVRKILIGIYLVMLRQIKGRHFIHLLRTAMGARQDRAISAGFFHDMNG